MSNRPARPFAAFIPFAVLPFAVLPFAAFPIHLHAQPVSPPAASAGDTAMPGVIVTATRSPEPVDRLISDVTAFDGDPARRALALTDRLRFGGGVQLSSTGGPGSTSTVLIRGANAGHALTLIDGFRVSSASLGQTTFEGLPLAHVQRLELLRGPASSLYGADALGGVIQLFTPPASPGLRGFGEAAAGGEGTRQLRGGVSGGNATVTASVRLSRDRSDGFNATTPGNFAYHPDRDGYRRDGVSARIDARLAPDTQLRAIALQNRLESQYDDGNFANARVDARTELLGLKAVHALDAVTTLEARVGQTTDRSKNFGNFPGSFESRLMQYGVSATREFGDRLQAQLLAERLEERVDSLSYQGTGADDRTTNSIGLIVTGDRGAHRLQAGVRIDDSNQYSTQRHLTLAYGYRIGGGVRLGASFATGFHAPGFNDLYFPGYGRAGIRPERARTVEIGAYWNQLGNPAGNQRRDQPAGGGTTDGTGHWQGKIVLFQSRVRDLVTYAPVCPDPDPQYAFGCADNVDRARITGLSVGLGQRPARGGDGRDRSGFGWSVDVDFLDPRNLTTDTRLPRRAKRQLTAGADYGLGPFTVGADLLTASRRYDDSANQQLLGGYLLLNLRAAYRIAPRWEAFATLFNAGDRRYATAFNYAQQGRLALLGVRYETP